MQTTLIDDSIPLYMMLFLVFHLYHSIGITLGYHRLLVHKSFKTKKFIEYFLVSGAYLAFQGGPISWCSTHKVHHMTVDTDFDVHSPHVNGFWYAFIGWMIKPRMTEEDVCRLVPELMKDRVYVFLGNGPLPSRPWLNLFICLGFRMCLLFVFGWQVALISLIAGVVAFISPQLVNTICHMPQFGYRRFKTNDESRNVMWLLPITYGENLHNAHHWKPRRASTSNVWWELDPTYWVLLVLERLGLAWDIKR